MTDKGIILFLPRQCGKSWIQKIMGNNTESWEVLTMNKISKEALDDWAEGAAKELTDEYDLYPNDIWIQPADPEDEGVCFADSTISESITSIKDIHYQRVKAKPVAKGFKVGGFVIISPTRTPFEIQSIICEMAVVKCSLTGEERDVRVSFIDRLAEEKDWIVEIDGVMWRAEYNSGGWINIWKDGKIISISGVSEGGTTRKKEEHIKAMEQICKAMNIPIQES